MHVDNKDKNVLILGEDPTQEVDDTTLTTEAKYSVNFTQSGKKIVLSLQYSGSNSFLYVNAVKMYKFKAKDSEIKPYPLCLGNISNNFIINNRKKKGSVQFLYVNYKAVNTNNVLGYCLYLLKNVY